MKRRPSRYRTTRLVLVAAEVISWTVAVSLAVLGCAIQGSSRSTIGVQTRDLEFGFLGLGPTEVWKAVLDLFRRHEHISHTAEPGLFLSIQLGGILSGRTRVSVYAHLYGTQI